MDKKIFYTLLFVAATGLCTGSFFEVTLAGTGKEQLMELLSGFFSTGGSDLSLPVSFWQNFRSGFLFLLLFYISPAVPILLPFNVLFLFFRSLFLGFSATMVLEVFGISGMGYVLATLVPCGLIQIFLFALLGALSLKEGIYTIHSLRVLAGIPSGAGRYRRENFREQKNRTALQRITGQYLYFYLAGLIVLILSSLLQVGLLQAVT